MASSADSTPLQFARRTPLPLHFFPPVALAFPLYSGFAFYFNFCQLGFWVSHVGFGFVGVFLGGLFGVSSGFWEVCWVWVLWGIFGASLGV